MFRAMLVAAAATLVSAGIAYADPIEGNWRTEAGTTGPDRVHATVSCCIQLKTGVHAGKSIGKLKAAGGSNYTGNITDPANDKTYSGKGALSGDTLKMSGCVFGGLICRSQSWTRR